MLKYFKTLHEVDGTSSTIAINPNQVTAVFETLVPKHNEEGEVTEESIKATVVITSSGNQMALKEEYIEVVAKLNEQ